MAVKSAPCAQNGRKLLAKPRDVYSCERNPSKSPPHDAVVVDLIMFTKGWVVGIKLLFALAKKINCDRRTDRERESGRAGERAQQP